MKANRTLARNLTELAEALDVDEESLRLLRQARSDVTPKATRQGRHNIPEWRTWLDHGGLKLLNDVKLGNDEASSNFIELKKSKLHQEIRKLKMENDEREEILSNPADQIQAFALACTSINTGFENMIKRAAPNLVGLKDQHEIEGILREEVEILINNLREFKFPD